MKKNKQQMKNPIAPEGQGIIDTTRVFQCCKIPHRKRRVQPNHRKQWGILQQIKNINIKGRQIKHITHSNTPLNKNKIILQKHTAFSANSSNRLLVYVVVMLILAIIIQNIALYVVVDRTITGKSIIGRVSSCFNHQPVIPAFGPINVTHGTLLNYHVNATDEDINTTFTYYDNTSLFNINSSTGNITFIPSIDDTGIYYIDITAMDDSPCVDINNFTREFTLNITNIAPVLSSQIPSVNITQDSNTTLNLSQFFSDADDANLTFGVMFIQSSSISFVFNGSFVNIIPSPDFSGNVTIKFFAYDGKAIIASNPITISISAVNHAPQLRAPIFSFAWPAGENVTDAFNLNDYFSDQDNDALNFTSAGTFNITIRINSSTHNVSFIPNFSFQGVEHAIFYANDSKNITASNNITLNVSSSITTLIIFRDTGNSGGSGSNSGNNNIIDGAGGCINECKFNTTECASNNSIRTCGNYDTDPCTEWRESMCSTPLVCSNAICIRGACDEKWECTQWSTCEQNNLSTRLCVDVNRCGTPLGKPEESQSCSYAPVIEKPAIQIKNSTLSTLCHTSIPINTSLLTLFIISLVIYAILINKYLKYSSTNNKHPNINNDKYTTDILARTMATHLQLIRKFKTFNIIIFMLLIVVIGSSIGTFIICKQILIQNTALLSAGIVVWLALILLVQKKIKKENTNKEQIETITNLKEAEKISIDKTNIDKLKINKLNIDKLNINKLNAQPIIHHPFEYIIRPSIRDNLKKGFSLNSIKESFLKKGWKLEHIEHALKEEWDDWTKQKAKKS